MKKRLAIQNRTVNVDQWTVARVKTGAPGKFGENVVFNVDDASVVALTALQYRLKFQLFCVKGFLLEAPTQGTGEVAAELESAESKQVNDGGE